MKKEKDMRFCVRCGMTPKEVRDTGYGGYCCVYGSHYGNHSYTTDRELDKWAKENGYDK